MGLEGKDSGTNRDSQKESTANITLEDTLKELAQMKDSSAKLHEELTLDTRISTIEKGTIDSQIGKLRDSGDYHAKRLEIEHRRHNDLLREIDIVRAELKDKEQQISMVSSQNPSGLNRQIRNLEHLYESTLQKHNEMIAQNKNLKENINGLRKERVIYDSIYTKMEADLKKYSEEYLQSIIETEKSNREKQIHQSLILQMKQAAEEEEAEFRKAYLKLTQEHDFSRSVTLQEFKLDTTANQNSISVIEKRAKQDNVLLLDAEKKADTSIQNPPKKKPVNTKQAELERMQEDVARYQVAIDKLKKQTNIDDLNRIVDFYNNFEQENLDLFSKTEQIDTDIDAAAQQLRELEKEIEKYEEPETQAESEKRVQLASLNKSLAQAQARAQEFDTKNAELLSSVDKFKEGIPVLLEAIGGNKEDLLQNIIEKDLSEHNIVAYLAAIEGRIDQILKVHESVVNQGILLEPKDYRKGIKEKDAEEENENPVLKNALNQVDKHKEGRENEVIMSPEQFQKIAQAIGQEKNVTQNSKTKSKLPLTTNKSSKIKH